jgi:hypothetical protein
MPGAVRCPSACRSDFPRGACVVSALLLLAGAAAAPAAAPRDELLRYVPDDVGFCFILQDFREQMKTLAASPFSEQLDKSPLGKAVASGQELKQLLELEKKVKQLLGLNPDELRDDILGDAVVFAFRPGPPGKPEQDEALVLVRARDEKKLRLLVDHVNEVQKKSGQLKSLDERAHNGVKYFRREEEKDVNYYQLSGPVLLFSAQESILKKALDRNRTSAADTEPPLARRLREAGLPRALFTAWINPRAFDDLLAARTAEAKVESDAAFLKNFAVYWKALDGAFVSLGIDKEFSLTVALQGRPDALPPAARKLFAGAAKPSELWTAFPENALVASAARLDFAALVEMLGDFMPKENRGAFQRQLNFGGGLGKDYLQDLGPDVGLALYAPAAGEKGWLPHAVFALRAAPGSDPTEPTDQGLVTLLNSFAVVAVVGHNQQHPEQPLELKRIRQGKREVQTLVGDKTFPPGVQPSLTLANGYLLLADSPETIRLIADALGKDRKAPEGDAVPLVQMSLKAWRAYLADQRKPLEQSMVERDKITEKEATARLDNLLGVLQFVDRVEISQRPAPGRTTLTISLQPAYPLTK